MGEAERQKAVVLADAAAEKIGADMRIAELKEMIAVALQEKADGMQGLASRIAELEATKFDEFKAQVGQAQAVDPRNLHGFIR
jgi:hypothetical protein